MTTAAQPVTRGRGSLRAGEGARGLMLVAPTILLLAVVILYPLVRAIIQSFHKDAGLDPSTGMFVQGGFAGLDNYRHWILQQCGHVACPPGNIGSQFYSSLWVTVFWTVVTVGLEVLLGLWFATIMNREFRGRALVRAAILVPWAIPTAVTAKLWFFIFAYDGIANRLLGYIGIHPLLWTSDTWPARIAVIVADTWKTTPFMALLILAGLQLISKEVYEAAQVDGAGRWQTFRQITLPLIKVPLMVAVLLRVLDVLRIFDLPFIMTRGANGTSSLSILVVQQVHSGFNSASALSTIVFLLITLVAFVFVKFLGADVLPRPESSKRRRRKASAEEPIAVEGAQV